MKLRGMKGIPRIAVLFGDPDPNPFAPLHRRLGIRTHVRRQAVLHDVHEGRRDFAWSFDPVNRVGPSNHLYRVSITLAGAS